MCRVPHKLLVLLVVWEASCRARLPWCLSQWLVDRDGATPSSHARRSMCHHETCLNIATLPPCWLGLITVQQRIMTD